MTAARGAQRSAFLGVTLERTDTYVGMTVVREPKKNPIVLSPQLLERLLDAASRCGFSMRLLVSCMGLPLSRAYGTGLRYCFAIDRACPKCSFDVVR